MTHATSAPATLRSFSQSLSAPTPMPTGWNAKAGVWLVAIVGMVFLLIPRTSSWTLQRIFAEDGQVFLSQTLQSGISGLFETYAGYLHVFPRLISNACVYIGPENYVTCTTVSSDFVRVVGMLIAFPVLTRYAGSWTWGLLAASTFLFIPVGQQEVLGNLTNLRWFLVAMAFFAVMGVFNRPVFALLGSLIVLSAVLSDPLALFLLPFALWRLFSVTGWWARMPAISLMIGAVIHIALIEPTSRETRGGFTDLLETPSQGLAQILVRGPLVTQIGMTGTQDSLLHLGVVASIALLVLPVAVLVIAWHQRLRPDPLLLFALISALVGTALLIITLSFPASYIALADIWAPGQPARYSLLAGLFLTPPFILILGRVWKMNPLNKVPRLLVLVSGTLMALGLLWDSGGDARHSAGNTWSEIVDSGRIICRETGIDPAFTTTPDYEGWRTQLTCDWLG